MLGVHTQWDTPPDINLAENVVGGRSRANLGLDWRASDSLRFVVEGRALWRGSAQRGLRQGKAYFEPTVGEAFLDIYTPHVDLRIGNQILAFGANAVLAPSDQLNPRDLRESFLSGDQEDVKIPTFAFRALGTIGPLSWTAVYAPFFAPDRYTVFGQDEALIQPSLGLASPVTFDPSIQDQIQPFILETDRPNAFPYLGDVGLRLGTEAGRVKAGASWVWMNEKLPAVMLDPELASFVGMVTRGEPADPSLALSIQNRFQSGERLLRGTHPRRHILSAEASTVIESVQIDLDLGYSPAQTFYDASLQALHKSAVALVLGVSQAAESHFLYTATYSLLAVPSVAAGEMLFLLEPRAAGGTSRTVFFHLLIAHVTYRLPGDKLQLGARAAFEPVQLSFALGPRVTYKISDGLSVWIGGEIYHGQALSPFGYFHRNDQVVAGVHGYLF